MNETLTLLEAIGALFCATVCMTFLHMHGAIRIGWLLRLSLGACAVCALIVFGTRLAISFDLPRLSSEFPQWARTIGPYATATALIGLWRYRLRSALARR